jgi:hypothetical protein
VLAACLIVVIVALDKQVILGHPGGLGRTLLKLALSLGLVIVVSSGLTSIFRFRTLFSVAWAVVLLSVVLWLFLGDNAALNMKVKGAPAISMAWT